MKCTLLSIAAKDPAVNLESCCYASTNEITFVDTLRSDIDLRKQHAPNESFLRVFNNPISHLFHGKCV